MAGPSTRFTVGIATTPFNYASLIEGLIESPVLPAHINRVYSVAYSYDNTWLALGSYQAASDNLRIVNPETGDILVTKSTGLANHGARFSKDNSRLLVGSSSTISTVPIWDTATWTYIDPRPPIGISTRVYDGDWNHDDSLFAAALHNPPYMGIWNTSDWSKLPNPLSLPTNSARSARFSSDGSLFVIGYSSAPWLAIYDTSDWSRLPDPPITPQGPVYSLSFSPDGQYLACGATASPFVTVYDIATWTKQQDLNPLPIRISYVSFGDDSSVLVVGADSVRTYDTSTWNQIDSVNVPNVVYALDTDYGSETPPAVPAHPLFFGQDF